MYLGGQKLLFPFFFSAASDLCCFWYEEDYYILRCYHNHDIKPNVFFKIASKKVINNFLVIFYSLFPNFLSRWKMARLSGLYLFRRWDKSNYIEFIRIRWFSKLFSDTRLENQYLTFNLAWLLYLWPALILQVLCPPSVVGYRFQYCT